MDNTTVKFGIDPDAFLKLVEAGKVTIDQIKTFVLNVKQIIESLTTTITNISPTVETLKLHGAIYADLSDKPVTLEDLGKWKPTGDFLSREDIQNFNRKMSQAISEEKWLEGFMFAIQLIAAMGGAI